MNSANKNKRRAYGLKAENFKKFPITEKANFEADFNDYIE